MEDPPHPQSHLRTAYGDPSHPDGVHSLPPDITKTGIVIRHPGYDENCNILMTLAGLDHHDVAIDYDLALAACAIVADNAVDGYFALDQPGSHRIARPEDGVLRAREFYFHVPGVSGTTACKYCVEATADFTGQYPVVPTFRDWRMPRSLPASWRQCPLSPLPVLALDVTCRITKHVEGTEQAHLVPKTETDWFNRNLMASFARASPGGIDAINAPANAITLRSDIHKLFDSKRFVVVPKQMRGSLAWFVHVIDPGLHPQMTELYHNVATQTLTGIAVEYLFARFAWSIFDHVQPFLRQGLPRLVSICDEVSPRTVELTGGELQARLARKSRSTSPQKKSVGSSKRSWAEDAEDEEHPYDRPWSQSSPSLSSRESTPWPSVEVLSWLADEEPCGRSRKRRFDPSPEPREITPQLTNDGSPSTEESQLTNAARDAHAPRASEASEAVHVSKKQRSDDTSGATSVCSH